MVIIKGKCTTVTKGSLSSAERHRLLSRSPQALYSCTAADSTAIAGYGLHICSPCSHTQTGKQHPSDSLMMTHALPRHSGPSQHHLSMAGLLSMR